LLENISCAQYFYNGTSGTHLATQSEGSADLSDLLSILPATIASLKDAGMYEDWLHYVRMVSENAFPLETLSRTWSLYRY
jgi:hypothetical protein